MTDARIGRDTGTVRAMTTPSPASDTRTAASPRHHAAGPAIAIEGLRKAYGDKEAVRGIDLEVRDGEILTFLGPNGAGKTTTVEILEGYRQRDAGTVSVLGADPQRAGTPWRQRIGVMLQSSSLYPNLTARESLVVFAGYYAKPRDPDEVIEIVGLTEKQHARVRT